MDLEKVTAVIRPRSDWEAVDLGIALVRRDYPRILLASALSFLPLMLVICGLLYRSPFLALLVVLWLRPLHDRVVLALIGPALFGENVKVWDLLKGLPRLWFQQIIPALTIRRISFVRSFLMPVIQLENLKGLNYRARRDVLTRLAPGKSGTALVVSLLLQIAFAVGLLFLLVGLNPLSYSARLGAYAVVLESLVTLGGQWKLVGALLVSTFLWGPFYVGAGFGSYLNARVRLEGWDLEIAYRRLGVRLAELQSKGQPLVGVILALILPLTLLLSPPVSAQEAEMVPSPELTSRENIDAVMASEDFEVEIYTGYEYRGSSGSSSRRSSSPSTLGPLVSLLAQTLLYALLAAAIAAAVYLIVRYIGTFKGGPKRGKKQGVKKRAGARRVMGMDIASEEIPIQFNEEALRLWQQGDHRPALALLYRGALSALVEKEHVPIRESDTENDCLRRAAGLEPVGKVEWFTSLTRVWMALAYGKQLPSDETVESLCRSCPFVPGAAVESSSSDPTLPARA